MSKNHKRDSGETTLADSKEPPVNETKAKPPERWFQGSAYKPHFKVQDIPSRGRSTRLAYQNRTVHLVSDLEVRAFRHFQWDTSVVEIEEQYALDVDATQRIAEEMGKRATELLASNITDNVDVLAGLRDRVELATLKLTAIAIQIMEKSLPIDVQFGGSVQFVPAEEVMQEFEEATSKLLEATAALTQEPGFNDADMVARIRIQAEINLLGAALFSQLLRDQVLFDDAEPLNFTAMREALVAAYQETKFELSLSAQVYIAVSAALEAGSAAAAADALAKIKSLTDGSHYLSDPDNIEISFFEMVLNGNASA